MKRYITNLETAICSECKKQCGISVEIDSQYNDYFVSLCCSGEVVDADGNEWIADVVEGEPEP